MSNNNKNKSTIVKLIDYFNEDEEEEEEEDDEEEFEKYNNKRNKMNSLGISGKFKSYSNKKENEHLENEEINNKKEIDNIKSDLNNNNKINNLDEQIINKNEEISNKNNEKQNDIFTVLYAKEGPDSSFSYQERPKSNNIDSKNSYAENNNTNSDYFRKAVSFHSEDELEINNNSQELKANNQSNIESDNNIQKDIKNENSIINDDNNTKSDIKKEKENEMKENNKVEITPNNKNENHLELDKNNLLQDLGKNYIDNESSFLRNNEDNELKKDNNSIPKNNRICDEDKYKDIKRENNILNNDIGEKNIIDTSKNTNNINNNIYDNYLLGDFDEKTLEEKEDDFLEMERKRKEEEIEKRNKEQEKLIEKEKIKKQKEKLLEQLRIKEEEQKILLKKKQTKELNKKSKKENRIDNTFQNEPLQNEQNLNFQNANNENNDDNNNLFESFGNSLNSNTNNNTSKINNRKIITNEESKYNKNIPERQKENNKILKKLINFEVKTENKTKNIIDKDNNKINLSGDKYNNSYKKPVELFLYDDAFKRKKKLENIDKNIMQGIKLNSNKTKIINESYKIAIEHDEKMIEKILNKYSFSNENLNKYLNILGIALSLRDMKIFRELFKEKNNNYYIKDKKYTLSDLKNIILSADKKEIRKIKEINFLQQTWLILNPEQNQYINKDIFLGLLKIIFSPKGSLNEIESLLKEYLNAVLIGIDFSKNNSLKKTANSKNIVMNNNKENNSKNILFSPISNKILSKKDVWPLSKYIKTFFELKKNLIAYKTIKNTCRDKYLNGKLKHEKIQSNLINTNLTLNNTEISEKNKINRKAFNFDKLYKSFLEKEQYKKLTLEQMRKEKEMEQLKELKEKPTISKYIPNYLTQNNFFKSKENIHERLYKMDKDIRAQKLEKIKEKERMEKEKLEKEINSHRLSINRRLDRERRNRSFDHPKKCRGFDEFVERNKKGRLERLRIKYLLEKNPTGERYEEIMRRNITPPNITDIRRMKEKEKNKKLNGINDNEKYFNENESEGNDEYFNLQIKLPNGKKQTLKIYENDDAKKIVEEFCLINSIDDNTKNKLIDKIEKCQKEFLNKDDDSYHKNEEVEEIED